MLPVKWKLLAQDDLAEIVSFIEQRNALAAHELREAIDVLRILHSRQQYP